MDAISVKLQPVLRQIASQSSNSQEYRSNIEDLLKLYKNIYQAAPNNEKFTRINLEKARSKLWSKAPAMENFMLQTGWKAEGGFLIFADDKNLRSTIDLLAKERTHVIPSHKEWVAETKVENITKNDGRDPREERLRQEAAKKRDAEIAACLADREQRRLLHENIKRNIQADIEHRRKMQESPSPSTQVLPLSPEK